MVTRPTIFIGYTRDDRERAEEVYQNLVDRGVDPWMNTHNILPGQTWQAEISKAIRNCDFVLVCCSATAVGKSGYLQKEIKEALEIWKEKSEDAIYFIPGRLEVCELPDSLRGFHWVDLFTPDGYTNLMKAIEKGMQLHPRTQILEEPSSIEPDPRQKFYYASPDNSEIQAGITEDSLITTHSENEWPIRFQSLITSLEELFGTEPDAENASHLRDIFRSIEELVQAITDLQKTQRWDSDLCVSFISGFLNEVVNKKAKEFQSFVRYDHRKLKLGISGAAITDSILSEHMKKMEGGDSYDVISDLTSWQDKQLKTFREQTEIAIERGVKVQRVFNLMRDSRLIDEEKSEILKQHLEDSRAWKSDKGGKYEVRIFTSNNYERLNFTNPILIDAKGSQIQKAHFGIFSHVKEGQTTVVEYDVSSDNLSQIDLWKNPEDIEGHSELFKVIWRATPPCTEGQIQSIFPDKFSD